METRSYNLVSFVMCFAICRYSMTQEVSPYYLDYLLNKGSLDEFIHILQIPNRDLVDPTQRKSSSVLQFHYNGLEFGDILLRPDQLLNTGQDRDFNGLIKYSFNKWSNGTVPYFASNALSPFTDDLRLYIEREISENNRLLGPNIVFRRYQPGDIDYVYIFNGGCGWFSNIGKVGGPQVISITSPLSNGFLTHELQHTLGFGHESNRKDRDEYIKLVPENINEVLKPQYIKFTSDNLMNLEPYDVNSIMHFSLLTPDGFNLTAFDVVQTNTDTRLMGIPTLKASDIQRAKSEYPLPA